MVQRFYINIIRHPRSGHPTRAESREDYIRSLSAQHGFHFGPRGARF